MMKAGVKPMKALLIGSSFSAMPMLMALKARGLTVTTIGKFGDDPCHKFADDVILEDYSDGATLYRICKDGNYDFIVPTSNDYSYLAAAFVADKMGFPGFDNPETTQILHVKNKFRDFCNQIGVPVPQTYGSLSVDQPFRLPEFTGRALVKPVDSFSGRGVSLVASAEEAMSAAAHAFTVSRTSSAVVEQFVDGALHSHTAFIADGEVIWHDFVDEFCEVYPYQVDRSTYPSLLDGHKRSAVHQAISKIVSALHLQTGLLHTQFIASEREFWIIECMRRCPGDLYGHQFKFSFGFNYEAAYVAGFLGEVAQLPEARGHLTAVERCVISTDVESPFFAAGLRTGGRELQYVPLKESGQKLGAAPFDKAGIAFLTGDAPHLKTGMSADTIFLAGYDGL